MTIIHRKKHVLVCQEHCSDDENKKTFAEYKSRFIDRQKVQLKEFSKSIELSYHADTTELNSYQIKCKPNNDDLITDSGIYTLQTIRVDKELYTLFFDSGCSDLVSRYDAVKRMKNTVWKQKYFEQVENAATEVPYRCVDCRSCQKCKNGEQIELLSIKEEVEQELINKSVTVDVKSGTTTARLPLMDDPSLKLACNKYKALAVY